VEAEPYTNEIPTSSEEEMETISTRKVIAEKSIVENH
jgi:hypothetical protein